MEICGWLGEKSCGRGWMSVSVTLLVELTTQKEVIVLARKYGSRAVTKQTATTAIGHRTLAYARRNVAVVTVVSWKRVLAGTGYQDLVRWSLLKAAKVETVDGRR
jgi:hypothetical protein